MPVCLHIYILNYKSCIYYIFADHYSFCSRQPLISINFRKVWKSVTRFCLCCVILQWSSGLHYFCQCYVIVLMEIQCRGIVLGLFGRNMAGWAKKRTPPKLGQSVFLPLIWMQVLVAQTNQSSPDILLANHVPQLFFVDCSVQGLPWGLLQVGRVQNTFTGRPPGGWLDTVPPELIVLQAAHLVSKQVMEQPLVKTFKHKCVCWQLCVAWGTVETWSTIQGVQFEL